MRVGWYVRSGHDVSEALSPRLAESQKGSHGGTKSGAGGGGCCQAAEAVTARRRWLLLLRSGIISQPSKLPSTFDHKNGHQVGSTSQLTMIARANTLPRYLILLSRQGKVVSAAAGVLARSRR